MSFLKKVIGLRQAWIAKRIIKDAEADVRVAYGPLHSLALAIVATASTTYSNLGQVFAYETGGKPSHPQMLTLFELLCFFAHITLRTAVAKGFSELHMTKLQDYMGSILASCGVDSFCGHWTEEFKGKIKSAFFDQLNQAEMDYAECKGGLVSSEDPLDVNTLIGRLAIRIAELWERQSDSVAKMTVALAALEGYKAAKLGDLVEQVATTIDLVDSELIRSFWQREVRKE